MDCDGPNRPRIVLVPFPLQGHITPMLQLGTILHAKGISVTVLHPEFNSPNASNHPEFTFLPLSDNLSENEASLSNAFQFISDINMNCRESFQEYMDQMMKLQELEGRVACVIYDSIMHFAESVATQFNIPSLVLHTSSAANLLAYRVILRLHEENLLPLPESQLDDAVPELGFLLFKDLPYSNIASKIPEPILQFFPSSFNIRSSKAVIWNSVESLEKPQLIELQQHYQVPFFSLGPIHKMAPQHNPTSLIKEDTSCITWLDKQAPNSVIYVSLGSIATIDAQELIETAIGLIDSEQQFLWVVRPNSVEGSEWMECLPDELARSIGTRGFIVKWAPQKEILAHSAVGAFWSHCGWNSTMEGISEGVPMLCRPFFADQRVNARYLINEWRVGIELENAENRTVVKNAIRRLLVDEEGKEMRQRSLDMKHKLEICVQKGGSSYNSLENLTQFILSM